MPKPESILVRTTRGARVGLGHYRRSRTLAEALLSRGAAVTLLVAMNEANDASIAAGDVTEEHFERSGDPDHTSAAVARLGAELIVADDYALRTEDLQAWRMHGAAVAVIDDLADRVLPVDLVMNGSAGAEMLSYCCAENTELLLGPAFALLRPDFSQRPTRHLRDSAERALVMFGGSDPLGLTTVAADAALRALPAAKIDVVIGPFARAPSFSNPRIALHLTPPDLPGLMERADVAVSAAGQTLTSSRCWERPPSRWRSRRISDPSWMPWCEWARLLEARPRC